MRVDIEEEMCLRITIRWPKVLNNIQYMQRVLIDRSFATKIYCSHSMVGGIHDALHKMKKNRASVVESFARIPLPFPVLPHPEKWLCAYDESSAMVLILNVQVPRSAFAALDDLPVYTAKQPVRKERNE